MSSVRRFATGLAASVAVAGLALATASPGQASTGRTARPLSYSKHWLNTWRNAPSYWYYLSSTDNLRAGTLFAGSNYFYCQVSGREYSYGGYKNHWWALTDDDSGNKRTWVSDVYISSGGNDAPVPGLPTTNCTSGG